MTSFPLNHPSPRRIGLTAGLCSGKSTFVRILQSHTTVPVWDADATCAYFYDSDLSFHDTVNTAYRDRTMAVREKLLQLKDFPSFGPHQQAPIDRTALRQWYLQQNPEERSSFHALWDRILRDEVQTWMTQPRIAAQLVVLWDVPLLLEAHWDSLVDEVWVIDIDPSLQWDRWTQRNPALSDEFRRSLLAQQVSRRERLWAAHRCLDNQGTLTDFESSILHLLQSTLPASCWRDSSRFARSPLFPSGSFV